MIRNIRRQSVMAFGFYLFCPWFAFWFPLVVSIVLSLSYVIWLVLGAQIAGRIDREPRSSHFHEPKSPRPSTERRVLPPLNSSMHMTPEARRTICKAKVSTSCASPRRR